MSLQCSSICGALSSTNEYENNWIHLALIIQNQGQNQTLSYLQYSVPLNFLAFCPSKFSRNRTFDFYHMFPRKTMFHICTNRISAKWRCITMQSNPPFPCRVWGRDPSFCMCSEQKSMHVIGYRALIGLWLVECFTCPLAIQSQMVL